MLPLHHPVHVAEMWATLDLLSNGRVDFATGRGYDRKEYRALRRRLHGLGRDLRGRHRRPAQGVELAGHLVAQGQVLRHPRDARSRPRRCRSRCLSTSRPSPRRASTWRRSAGSTSSTRRSPPGWCSAGSTRRSRATARPACKAGKKPGRAMCSYFIYIADDAKAGGLRPPEADGLLQPLRAAGLPAEEGGRAADDAVLPEDRRHPEEHEEGGSRRQARSCSARRRRSSRR